MSAQRSPAQIPARSGLLLTGATVWIYPRSNILAGLAAWGRNYTFDGTVVTATTMVDVAEICYAIWYSTKQEVDALLGLTPQDNGDGYDVGNGSLLQEMGDEIHFKLPGGPTVLIWRQIRSLTSQSNPSYHTPVGTVGFIPVFVAQGNTAVYSEIDPVRVTRLG